MSDDKVRLPATIQRALDDFCNASASVETDGEHFRMYETRLRLAIARTVAADDAREERLKAAESAARVCREDAEANATRAERIERMFHQAERERDEWKDAAQRMVRGMNRVVADRYEWKARATKAEAEAALLRARIDAPSTRRDEKTAPNPTDPRNHAAAAASGAAGTERKEP